MGNAARRNSEARSTRKPVTAHRTAPLAGPKVVRGTPQPVAVESPTIGASTALAGLVDGTSGGAETVSPSPRGSPVAAGGCAAVAEAGYHGLAATYWCESGASDQPYSVTIRFTGTRLDVNGQPEAGDRFEQTEQVDGIIPASGQVAITTRVQGVNPGEWRITATPIRQFDSAATATRPAHTAASRLYQQTLTEKTRLAHLVHGPGVRLFFWPALVCLGVVVAIIVQAMLIGRAHLDVAAIVAISGIACVLGYLGAKVWYLVLHRQHPRTFLTAGTCIQGFLLAAIGTMVVALAVLGVPLGTVLDATTPGLFLAMSIGRPGCFLGGCCAGRPTASRWGLWSSDRRLGVRRVPIQLVEAAVALMIGLGALALVLTVQVPVGGAVFVGAVALYTLCRQLLFPLRAEPRKTSMGRALTMAACGVVLLADLVVSVIV